MSCLANWIRLWIVVAIRYQAVDGGARKASTVWRQVATSGDRWLRPG